MRWIADSRIVWRESFFADVTTHRATVRFPLLFSFHGHVGGYNIFHAPIIELSCELRYTVFIAMEDTITRHCTRIACSSLC